MACERSGRVRDAFRTLGHDAMSADIEPTDVDGPHHQGDVTPLLRHRWDMVIAFPPCTDLSYVNTHHLVTKRADGRTAKALGFFWACWAANAPKVCVENPRGVPQEHLRYTQVIQPWEYGHPYTKATCLWLRGLPPLMPTFSGQEGGTVPWVDGSARRDGKHHGVHRDQRMRSQTFPGIAQAMAHQWGT